MKTSEIFALWDVDSKIDTTQLHIESIKIAELHNKYSKIFFDKRARKRILTYEFKTFLKDKREFYLLGNNEETDAKGWKLPERGRVLKPDLDFYLDSDKDIIAYKLKIGLLDEQIELLESIIKTILNRSFQIKNAIEYMRFMNGN